MKPPPNRRHSKPRVVAAKIKRPVADVDEFEDENDEEELEAETNEEPKTDSEEEEFDEPKRRVKSKRKEVTGDSKGFFDTLSDTFRQAGETAKKYTRIGVSHAEIEKLRFDLKNAHAELGEVIMRCWHDAPDLGLTSRDPAIIQAYRRVKEVRRQIREREARIAELKSDR